MEYMNVVRDFAERTITNLDFVKAAQQDPTNQLFEFTQLINSLLGLLVFPQQNYMNSIPEIPLDALKDLGWPIPKVVGDYPQAENLRKLIRLLRHSIAHFNVKFITEDRVITGVRLWNINPRSGKTTWKAEMTEGEIELLARKFVDLLLSNDSLVSS